MVMPEDVVAVLARLADVETLVQLQQATITASTTVGQQHQQTEQV